MCTYAEDRNATQDRKQRAKKQAENTDTINDGYKFSTEENVLVFHNDRKRIAAFRISGLHSNFQMIYTVETINL